jgi:hypothetical protein
MWPVPSTKRSTTKGKEANPLKSNSDFSPIAEQGELELEAGLFSRLRRRREMAPLSPGFTRVLIDADSEPIDEFTAGQKYWSRARGWVQVDMRTHSLEYRIPLPDPSGLAGFLVVVDISASVCDPRGAVSAGAESVEEILRPALQNALRKAHTKAPTVDGSDNPVTALNNLRLTATENLEKVIGAVEGVPGWLSAKVTSLTVELDEATEKHREELIEKMRAVALADADGQSEMAKAKNQLKVHQIWEEGFADRLADPERRALARIAADPSRENIDRVAGEFDEIEAQGRAAMVEVFRAAVEKGYFAEDEAILNAINVMEKQVGRRQGALERGDGTKQVEAPEQEEHVVEAETIETDTHEDSESDSESEEEEDSDTDWGK